MNLKILVINGPNLNLLGKREPEVYGHTTLQDLYERMKKKAEIHQISLSFFQSNHEGEVIDRIQEAMGNYKGLIINPGAFTHYSYAIRDAISAVNIPTIEVHISNIHAREEFRHNSVIAPIATGQISGLGLYGYLAAIDFFVDYFQISNSK